MNKSFVLEWKIYEYYVFHTPAVQSPIFVAENLQGSRWCLEICHFKEQNSEYLSSNLYNLSNNEMCINYKLDLIGYDRETNTLARRSLETIKSYGISTIPVLMDYRYTRVRSNNKLIIRLTLEIPVMCENLSTLQCNENFTWCKATTRMSHDKVTFSEEYSVDSFNKNQYVVCRNYTSKDLECCLVLVAPNDGVTIEYIQRKNRMHLAEAMISLQYSNRSASRTSRKTNICFPVKDYWEFVPFFTLSELRNNGDTFLVDGKFKVHVTANYISYDNQTVFYASKPISASPRENTFRTLKKDFNSMLSSGNYSDLSLKTASSSFAVHKAILSARSPAFRSIIENMNGNNSIDCSRLHSSVLFELLHYIYLGKRCNDFDSVETTLTLLEAAHDSKLLFLVQECTLFLIEKLSFENVYEIAAKAEFLKHKELLSAALHFIEEHVSRLTPPQESRWFTGLSEQLQKEILSKFS